MTRQLTGKLTSELTKLRRAAFVPVAILAILVFAIVGLVLFRVAADQKPRRVDQKPRRVVLTWKPSPPKPGVTVAGYEYLPKPGRRPLQKTGFGRDQPDIHRHPGEERRNLPLLRHGDKSGRRGESRF